MPEQNASFIPKNFNQSHRKVRTTKRIYLLSYVSYIFFFGTLIAVLAVYFYTSQINNQLTNVKAELDKARTRFSADDINEVRTLEKQLISANYLLDNSAAPSNLFSRIEAITASNIQFTAFEYERLPGNQFTVTLEGRAKDFNQVIYQKDLFKTDPILNDADLVSFDYNLSEAGDNTGNAKTTLPKGDAALSFVFADKLNIKDIPYVPENPIATSEAENVVVSPAAGTVPDATTTEEAVVEVIPKNSTE